MVCGPGVEGHSERPPVFCDSHTLTLLSRTRDARSALSSLRLCQQTIPSVATRRVSLRLQVARPPEAPIPSPKQTQGTCQARRAADRERLHFLGRKAEGGPEPPAEFSSRAPALTFTAYKTGTCKSSHLEALAPYFEN